MKRRTAAGALALTLVVAVASADSPFDGNFEDATLRIDYFHVGDAEREFVALDRIYRQGVWAGSRTQLVDPFPYGGYSVEARDAATGDLVYSQGFDSYFGEYRTTGPAAEGTMRTYHETVLLPFPKKPIQVVFTARRRDGTVAPAGGDDRRPGFTDDRRRTATPGGAGRGVARRRTPATGGGHRHPRRGLHGRGG